MQELAELVRNQELIQNLCGALTKLWATYGTPQKPIHVLADCRLSDRQDMERDESACI